MCGSIIAIANVWKYHCHYECVEVLLSLRMCGSITVIANVWKYHCESFVIANALVDLYECVNTLSRMCGSVITNVWSHFDTCRTNVRLYGCARVADSDSDLFPDSDSDLFPDSDSDLF